MSSEDSTESRSRPAAAESPVHSADLAGRVVIITGGGRGLGRAFALESARRGAAVVVNNRNRVVGSDGRGPADEVVAEIGANGGRAIADYSDAADPDAGDRMVASALSAFGRVDGIVTSAAISYEKSAVRSDPDRVAELIDINLLGTMRAVTAAARVLGEQGSGNIVIVGSTAGLYGGHGLSAYAAAKAATIGFGRSLALESISRGVYTNVVLPYAVTQMTRTSIPESMQELLTAASVAPVVASLLSPRITLNGEIIVAAADAIRTVRVSEGASVRLDEVTPDSLATALAASEQGPWTTPSDAPSAFRNIVQELVADVMPEQPSRDV